MVEVFREEKYYRIKLDGKVFSQAFYRKNGEWFYTYLENSDAEYSELSIIGQEFCSVPYFQNEVEPFLNIFVRKEKLSKLLEK